MVKKRIGISGWMGSGKTTCSEYLISRYGYKRVSFAEPIKRIVEGWLQRYCKKSPIGDVHYNDPMVDWEWTIKNQLFYLLRDIFPDDIVQASEAFDILVDDIFPRYMDIDWSVEKSDKWRKCLQEVGGGRIRSEIDNDVWIKYLVSKLEPDGLYICDDLRYVNEYNILGNNGFISIRLDITRENQMDRLLNIYGEIDPQRLLHSSETDLDNTEFPYIVDANQELIWVLHDLMHIVEEA